MAVLSAAGVEAESDLALAGCMSCYGRSWLPKRAAGYSVMKTRALMER